MKTAYDKGFESGCRAKTNDNNYEISSKDWHSWWEGYNDAVDAMIRNDVLFVNVEN